MFIILPAGALLSDGLAMIAGPVGNSPVLFFLALRNVRICSAKSRVATRKPDTFAGWLGNYYEECIEGCEYVICCTELEK